MHRHVLVVMPHPDDETFSSAGTIALFTKAGVPVTYACGTRGELGRNMGNPVFASRESLPILREKELRDACAILGCDVRMMGLRDKTVEFMDPAVVTAKVRELIDEIQPSLVITYYPGYGLHPDHNALGAATVRAVAEMAPEQRPTVYCKAIGEKVNEKVGEPDIVTDISSVADIKMAAIKAHRSQSEVMLARLEARMAEDPALREQTQRDRAKETFWTYTFN